MVKTIDHIAIVVSNIEKEVWFYEKVLGCKVIEKTISKGADVDKLLNLKDCFQEIVSLGFDESNVVLELIKFKKPKLKTKSIELLENALGIRHLCFSVSDIKKLYNNLLKENIRFISEPIEKDNGDKYVFLRDRENNSIELKEVAIRL